MGKLLKGKNLKRTLFDPGGTIIHRLTSGTWDRGAHNARSAVAPWSSNEPQKIAPVAPLPDEEDVQRAKRRSARSQLGRSGRSSTILSDSDRLGP